VQGKLTVEGNYDVTPAVFVAVLGFGRHGDHSRIALGQPSRKVTSLGARL